MSGSSNDLPSDPKETMEPVTDATQTIPDAVQTVIDAPKPVSNVVEPKPDVAEPASHAIDATKPVSDVVEPETEPDVAETASHAIDAAGDAKDTGGDAMDTTLDGPVNSNAAHSNNDPMAGESAVDTERVDPEPSRLGTGLPGCAPEGRPVPSTEQTPTGCNPADSPKPPPRKLGSLFSPEERKRLEEEKNNVEQGKAYASQHNERTAVHIDEDELAEEEDFSEDEVDHAAVFADMKKDYEKKKARGKNTFADDIAFMKAEKTEQARLKRLETESLREAAAAAAASMPVLNMDHEGYGDAFHDDGDSLFLTEGPLRQSATMEPVVVDDDVEMADGDIADTQQPTVPKKAGRGKHRIRKADAEASMRAGMEADIAKEAKVKKRSSRKTPGMKTKTVKAKPAQKKVKDPKAKVTKAARGRPKGKAQKNPTKTLNLDGLAGYNLYAAANANSGRAGVGDVNEKRKADQLKALIASVPETDMRSARADKKLIDEATKRLSPRNVRPAPGGMWKVKGMKLPITNHQVLGASEMKDRETGTDSPFGGLLADDMGIGKTVQTIAMMVANPPFAW